MTESKDDELILCTPAAWVAERIPVGFTAADALPGVWPVPCELRRRGAVEHDEDWRQWVTYTIIRCGDGVFVYQRGESGGEGRLHGLLSVGVGGHVGAIDIGNRGSFALEFLALVGFHVPSDELFGAAAWRELVEEVEFRGIADLRVPEFAGFLRCDETPVDRCHVGAVFVCEAWVPRLAPREDCLRDGRFGDPADLDPDSLESWSRLLLQSGMLDAGPGARGDAGGGVTG